MQRAHVADDQTPQAVVAERCQLVDDVVGHPDDEEFLDEFAGNLRHEGQRGLLIDQLRDEVLHAFEVCAHRMFGAVARPVRGRGVQREQADQL